MERNGLSYGDFLREYHAHGVVDHTVEDTRAKPKVPQPKPRGNEKPPRRVGKIVVVLLLVLMGAVSACLLIADFFLPQGIVGWVENVFAPTSTYLYAVATRADSIDEARTISGALRGQGAAGFVAFDGSYYVLLSVYPTKEQADAVAAKGGYVVYPLCVDQLSQTDFPLSIRGKVKDILSYPTDLYESLYQLSTGVQDGSITAPQAKITAYNLKAALEARTRSFRSAAVGNGETLVMNYNASLSAVLAALDNLANSKQEGAAFLADIRWTYILALRVNRL